MTESTSPPILLPDSPTAPIAHGILKKSNIEEKNLDTKNFNLKKLILRGKNLIF